MGWGAGLHPPARMGPFQQKCLGPKEKSSGCGLREPEPFYKLRSNTMGCVLPKDGKFCICITPKAASPAAQRGETNTWSQQQNVPLAIEKLRNCLKIKRTNGGETAKWWKQKRQVALCFPLGSPHELGGSRRTKACLHNSWCLQINIEVLWKNPIEFLLPIAINLPSAINLHLSWK